MFFPALPPPCPKGLVLRASCRLRACIFNRTPNTPAYCCNEVVQVGGDPSHGDLILCERESIGWSLTDAMQRPNSFVSSIKDRLEWFAGEIEAWIPVEKGFSFITGLQGTPDCKIRYGVINTMVFNRCGLWEPSPGVVWFTSRINFLAIRVTL